MVNEISKQTISLVSSNDVVSDAGTTKPVQQDQIKVSAQDRNEEVKKSFDELVTQTAKKLNVKMQSIERDLQFNVDEISGDTIITVLDSKTSEVIRQIPSEEVLAIRENIESLKGILFSAEV